MSDFRYLDYEGLATYTEHVKEYADGKIVYISDESEIPNPPKEGTLYVIGSEILMDEEIIIGTQNGQTSNWTGKSIDTRLHDGKRIAYYLPFTSYAGTVASLTLELSDEDNTTVQSRIYANGAQLDQTVHGGSVVRMMYFENIIMNGSTISGWICDAIMDNSQNCYEVSVDLTSYGDSSTSLNIPATTQGVGSFKVGDKIRIKSTLDFPTGQLPTQARVQSSGYDVSSYMLNRGGEVISKPIGILRWPTSSAADTEILTALRMDYNAGDPFPEQAILKYGGFIDVIIIGVIIGTQNEYICAPIFNNGCGHIASNATNASKVNISTSSTSSSYPLVFTNNVAVGNKSLYTDTDNSCHYNPSSNTLTSPTVSATTVSATNIKTSSIANIRSGSTITFNDVVSLKDYSYLNGSFSIKGLDHNNPGVSISGGSTTTPPTITIKAKNSNTTNGIILTGRDGSTAAKIVVYSGTGGTCTITGGSTSISSDERLKDFTNDIDIDFDKLKKIPKKYFTWKHDDEKVLNIGTSAQVVENVYPEIVDENLNEDEGTFYKSVDYSKLSIVALAAIDKLNERIEYLENKLKEYEK